MLTAVGVDPVTEGAFLDVQLAGDPSDGLGTLGDHLDRFFAEFRRKSLTLFWHRAPRFWTEILLGPCPESKRRSRTLHTRPAHQRPPQVHAAHGRTPRRGPPAPAAVHHRLILGLPTRA